MASIRQHQCPSCFLQRVQRGTSNSSMPCVTVGSGSLEVGTGPAELGLMRESSALMSDEVLLERLREDGFLLIRNLVPRELVLAGRAHICAGMQQVN